MDKTKELNEDGVTKVRVEHRREDNDELPGVFTWSSDAQHGALLWSYADQDRGAEFDPPVQFDCPRMDPGHEVGTNSANRNWLARFEDVEGCACFWVPGWSHEDCIHISLDDGDGDSDSFGRVTGDWWLVPRYGPAQRSIDADGARWSLCGWDWEE